MIWTLIEPGVYLIAACLPNLRPIWVHFKGTKQTRTDDSYQMQAGTGMSSKGSKYMQLEKGGQTDSTATARSLSAAEDEV